MEEKRRYLGLLESIKDQFDLESTIGEELFEALLRHESVKTMIDAKVDKLVSSQVDVELSNARQKSQSILDDATKKKNSLESDLDKLKQEIMLLKKEKEELNDDIELARLELSEEQVPAMERLEHLVADVKLLRPLFQSMIHSEQEQPHESNISQDRTSTLEPPIPVSHEICDYDPIDDWQTFTQKRLLPLLYRSGLDVRVDDVEKFVPIQPNFLVTTITSAIFLL